LIEEPEEEKLTLQVESYINSEESIMAGREEEGQRVLNVEFALFRGGRGRGNDGEDRGNREVDEETDATMKISHLLSSQIFMD